jgi:hypothetical protein
MPLGEPPKSFPTKPSAPGSSSSVSQGQLGVAGPVDCSYLFFTSECGLPSTAMFPLLSPLSNAHRQQDIPSLVVELQCKQQQ